MIIIPIRNEPPADSASIISWAAEARAFAVSTTTQAAAMGGNVRVGMEDSIWAGRGVLAKSNADQVKMARQIIEGLGMEVATPDEAREILSLKGGDQVAF